MEIHKLPSKDKARYSYESESDVSDDDDKEQQIEKLAAAAKLGLPTAGRMTSFNSIFSKASGSTADTVNSGPRAKECFLFDETEVVSFEHPIEPSFRTTAQVAKGMVLTRQKQTLFNIGTQSLNIHKN